MTRVRRPLVGLLIGVLGLSCGTGVVAAQTAQVVHNVNLRADPSPNNSPIRLLMPPEDLSLISTIKQNGYFHVRTAKAEDGWVWSLNVEVITTPPAPPPPPPLPLGIATSLSSSWEKAAPNHSQYTNGNGEVCGAFGTPGADANTNVRKNRKDIHGACHPVTVDALANAPYPAGAPTKRSGWTAAQLAIIEPFEGEAVSVIGYLAAVTNEGKEKTNCSFSKAVDGDWHLALVEHEDDDEPDAIVVEVTPRVRRNHDTWTLARLRMIRDHNIEVRISEWTMLDPDHPGHIGTYRSTLWEIHPITKLEIRQNGAWVDLDNQ